MLANSAILPQTGNQSLMFTVHPVDISGNVYICDSPLMRTNIKNSGDGLSPEYDVFETVKEKAEQEIAET